MNSRKATATLLASLLALAVVGPLIHGTVGVALWESGLLAVAAVALIRMARRR